MDDQPTGSGASGDGTPDYAAKYNGLMSAFGKRTSEFADKEAAYEAKIADLEAKASRLAEFEAAEAAAAEEAEFSRLAQERGYGRLHTPLKHGGRDVTATGGDDGSAKALREKVERGEMFTGKPTKLSGWPT
jgi:hypothetical protein